MQTDPHDLERVKALVEEARRTMPTTLNLSSRNLTNIPDAIADAIGELVCLQVLELRNNRLTEIPEALGRLGNLKYLDLSNNQIATLPHSLINLNKLQHLDVRGNPLPEELLVAASRGVSRLFRYLKSTAQGKAYPRT